MFYNLIRNGYFSSLTTGGANKALSWQQLENYWWS